eukprot:5007088-Karenia_brevis.AAC.1
MGGVYCALNKGPLYRSEQLCRQRWILQGGSGPYRVQVGAKLNQKEPIKPGEERGEARGRQKCENQNK